MATALQLTLTMDENGGLKITGIPPGEEERKMTIQVLAQAIKTVAALKPSSPIISLNGA